MMSGPRCPHAYRQGAQDDTMRCKKMEYPNNCCAHVKYCRRTNHWENSEAWPMCPMLKIKTAGGNKNE